MSVLCIVQARLGSERLPGKILMDIGGKPMIQHVVERARQMRGVDRVVVAVPDWETSRALADYGLSAIAMNPSVPTWDVLTRFALVSLAYDTHETIMRVTGDCPLLDPRVGEAVLALYRRDELAHGCQYAWNDTTCSGYADGLDVEVFARHALMQADRYAVAPSDREHVTPWIRRRWPVAILRKPGPPDTVKLSVDTLEDLARVRAIVAGVPV